MITVEHLTKVPRRRERARAVDDVSFACAPGTVTGFLGPRGAGKSTTLRILTGLARPTSGRAEILGRAYRDLPNPGRAVGVMLDASALAPARTGRETLRLTAALLGLTDPGAVDGALADAGLRHAARTRVGAYPVGLRHRLAIANALLGDPAVLVLDEPVPGLDPNGVRWLWRVIRAFADEGGTVLISARRPDDLRPDRLRPDGLCPDGLRADDFRADDFRPGNLHPDGLCPDGLRADDFRTDDLRPDRLRTDDLRTDGLCPGNLRPDDLRPGNLRAGVDRVVVIAEGRVVAYGSAGDLLGASDRGHGGPSAARALVGDDSAARALVGDDS